MSRESERNVHVWRAMRAATHRIPVTVNGVERGTVATVVGGHEPAREPRRGGSTQIVRFDDGAEIPAEDIDSIERT